MTSSFGVPTRPDIATWHVVKYMPDTRRREPRNVGVVLATSDGWLSKFVGEDSGGSIMGNRLARDLEPDVYKTWVSYYRRKAEAQRWEDVYRHQERHPVNFITEIGGQILESDGLSWEQLVERLFRELVQEPTRDNVPERPEGPRLRSREFVVTQAVSAMRMARVDFVQNVDVDVLFDKHRTIAPFEFAHALPTGSQSLMDAITGRGRDPGAPARELRSRIIGARDAGSSRKFVTFYASEAIQKSRLDQVLAPLEEASFTIDVMDVSNAADQLSEALVLA